MEVFQKVEGAEAVLYEKGVFKSAPVYTRNGYLHAQVRSGFIRLSADGGTSKKGCALYYLRWNDPIYQDAYGRLIVHKTEGARDLDPGSVRRLTGGQSFPAVAALTNDPCN